MKKSLLTLLATAIGLISYAQCSIKEVPLTMRSTASSDIIEGKVVAKNSFWNLDHTMIYTANTIEVYKVFKGAISVPSIEIITTGGIVGMDKITVEPSLELKVNDVGIFTCEPVSHVRANPPVQHGVLQFECYASSQGFVKYDLNTQTASDPFRVYPDIQNDVFNVLSHHYTEIQPFDYRNYGSSTNRNGPPSSQSVTITNFSPTTLTAGTNTVLTINGSGFGSSQGSGNVGFKNADDGGATYINPLTTQIISWSSTQIMVEVPSGAGTGTIQVTQGTTTTSSGTLTISYAEQNVEFDPGTGTEAYQTDHINDNGTGGYTWRMNTAFDAATTERASFMRAFDTWRCNTGVNWSIGATTSINDAVSDGTNVICNDNTAPLPAGVLGVCYSYWSGCASGPTIIWYVNELDIIFDDGSNLTSLGCTWEYGPALPTISEYDFETVAVHELGHGHQLGHVILNGQIMHYAISNGASHRSLAANDLAGANDVQARSVVTNICGPGAMTAFSCASPPVANFSGTPTTLCAGGSVAFTDLSTNTPTSWSWTFTGGTPSSSTSQNPTITYNTAGSYAVSLTATNASGSDPQTFNGYITVNANPNATASSQTNISCNGGSNGSATVSVSSGTSPYSYNWTPGNPTGDGTVTVTGLTAQTYTCTVTDANSCTDTQTFTITQPSVLNATAASQTNISCNGGSNGAASVNVSGGTTSYSFNWTPGNPTGDGTASVTGLTAQTYTCTVTDANGCTDTQTFTITQPSVLNVTAASQTNISCNGGSNGAASVSVSGGTTSYSFNWTPGNPTGDGTASVTGLTAQTYTCTVTDANGCTDTQTFTITQPSVLVASAASQTNISCNGGSNGAASVSVSGGTTSYSFNWTPGNPTGDGTASVTGLTAGTYTCTVTDANGCTDTQTFTITQPSAISSSASSNPSTCAGNTGSATVSASGGTGALTYSWAPSGGTAATANNLAAGTYTCTITDANSCTATQTVTVGTTSGPSASVASQTNTSCNSVCDGSATISASGGTSPYTYSWSPSGGTAATASSLCAGTYTCTVTDASSCIATQTVTITQPSPVNVGFTSNPANGIICSGSQATLSGTGASSYLWTGGVTNAVAFSPTITATYTVTGTDVSGCSNTATATITVNNCAGGASHLTPAYCGFTETLLTDNILYTATPSATNYRIRVSNPTLGYSQVFTRGNYLTNFNMNLFTGILYNTTYNVDISAYVGTAWGQYGSVCTLTTPASAPLSRLSGTSCGMTGVTNSTNLYYTAIAGATNYRIRITCSSPVYSRIFTRGNNATYFLLSSFTGIQTNTTYNVEIAALVNNVWGSYGPICTISTGAALRLAQVSGDSTDAVSLNAYPNPTNDVLHLDASSPINGVRVYSLTGELVSTYGKVDEISMVELPAGTYIVEVQTETGIKRTLVIRQ